MEKEASSTDDTSSFTLLVSCTSGLSLSQVSVACSEAYDRIPHSEIWEQRSQKNNSLFNGKKFRPQEIGITSHQYDKELTESVNIKVSQEIFDSIVREVVEEIGVPASSLIEVENMTSRMPGFALYKLMADTRKIT
ncbi:hypothetical protein JHK86_031079 [Glycine max]|nr:hypothetical protein JHK86_031079 [Glycine max]